MVNNSLDSGWVPAIGRILLSAIFIMSGVNKIMNWDATAEQMAAEGMMWVQPLLIGAIVIELAGGLSVLFGCWARVGAALLIVFLVPTTLIFHDFWTCQGQQQQTQMIHFMKNVSIMGGLFLVLGWGAGTVCVDAKRALPGNGNSVDRTDSGI